MSKATERIWIDHSKEHDEWGFDNYSEPFEGATEYIPRDLARAQVAMAYENAAQAQERRAKRLYYLCATRQALEPKRTLQLAEKLMDVIAPEIRELTPDDAQAALDAMLKAERAKVLKEAEEICTNIIKNYDVMKPDGKTYEPLRVQRAAKGMVKLAREDIRALAQETG